MSLVIHVWPASWNLASIDPACLAAVLYLQFAFPGHFSISEETNPDASPSGQLPYLTHHQSIISPVSSIISYLSALNPESLGDSLGNEAYEVIPSLGATLSPLQKQQDVAWKAYIEQHVGDLVAHSFYSYWPNYSTLTRPTLVSFLPWPQKFYVPGRIREMHRPRLQSALMWNDDEDERNPLGKGASALADKVGGGGNTLKPTEEFKKAFAKERVLEKARTTFDLITRTILQNEDEVFAHGPRPSSLDIILSSHILLILHAPLPDPFLKTLLLESYPKLISHACLVHSRAFPSSSSSAASSDGHATRPRPVVLPRDDSSTVYTALTSIPFALSQIVSSPRRTTRGEVVTISEKEKELERNLKIGRWLWGGLALVGVIGYAFGSGIVAIEVAQSDDAIGEGDMAEKVGQST